MADLQTALEAMSVNLHEARFTGAGLVAAQRAVSEAIGSLEQLDLGFNFREIASLTLVADQSAYERGAGGLTDPVALTGELPADLMNIVDLGIQMRYPDQTTGHRTLTRMNYEEWRYHYISNLAVSSTPQRWSWFDGFLYIGPAPNVAYVLERIRYRRTFSRPDFTFNGSSWTPEAGTFTNDLFIVDARGPSRFNLLVEKACAVFAKTHLKDANAAGAHESAFMESLKQHQYATAGAAGPVSQHFDEPHGAFISTGGF